jgi:hypothetical protein
VPARASEEPRVRGRGELLDRRAFLAGVATTAAAVTAPTEAAAHPPDAAADLPQALGEVKVHLSPRALLAASDDGTEFRVVLARRARVARDGRPGPLSEFAAGDWFIAVGQPAGNATFLATRVIPAAIGAKQPPR